MSEPCADVCLCLVFFSFPSPVHLNVDVGVVSDVMRQAPTGSLAEESKPNIEMEGKGREEHTFKKLALSSLGGCSTFGTQSTQFASCSLLHDHVSCLSWLCSRRVCLELCLLACSLHPESKLQCMLSLELPRVSQAAHSPTCCSQMDRILNQSV